MKPAESASLIAMLAAAFPEFTLSDETLQLYTVFLSDVPAELGGRAAATWIARERRFPRIAELRELVERVGGDNPPDLDQAWKEVTTAARAGRVPPNGWSHRAIRAAVEAVGFNDIRTSTTPGVERAHFEKAYAASAARLRNAGSAQLVEVVMPSMRRLMAGPDQARSLSEGRKQLPGGKKDGS